MVFAPAGQWRETGRGLINTWNSVLQHTGNLWVFCLFPHHSSD